MNARRSNLVIKPVYSPVAVRAAIIFLLPARSIFVAPIRTRQDYRFFDFRLQLPFAPSVLDAITQFTRYAERRPKGVVQASAAEIKSVTRAIRRRPVESQIEEIAEASHARARIGLSGQPGSRLTHSRSTPPWIIQLRTARARKPRSRRLMSAYQDVTTAPLHLAPGSVRRTHFLGGVDQCLSRAFLTCCSIFPFSQKNKQTPTP